MVGKLVPFSDQIRAAINSSGKTRYQIWQETGIDQGQLSKFMSGTRGLSIDALDRLAECIGMAVVIDKPRTKKGR